MTDPIHCPDCGTTTPEDARFCPGCGRPRTFLREALAEEARATGTPYTELLDRTRAEELANEPVAFTLARLERRLNEIEAASRYTPASRRAAATPAARNVPAESAQRVEIPRAPAAPIAIPAPEPSEPFDIEKLITGRVLAWVGGLAIALGAAFFLSLAFSSGWIGPAARVSIGVVSSLVMLAGGAFFFERKERLFGHVLVATALGVMSFSLLAATRLYDFIPTEIGVLSAVAVAAIAAVIAIRADAQIVAAFGLVAALAAPPLVGAEASYATLAFVAIALGGTVAVALFRSWGWLPPLAFILSAPQAANYLTGDVNAGIALAVLAIFWSLFILAASGEAYRLETVRLSPTSATVLVANAAFTVGMGMLILDGALEGWRGLYLVGVAVAHGAVGGYFLMTRGELNPFGMLATGAGIGALALAIPVQFGGPVVPILWAALATALVWVYARREHVYSGGLGLLLGIAAVAHLFRIEYPLRTIPEGVESAWPYINSSGATLGFLLAALGICWYLVRHRLIRPLLIVAGAVMIALTAPFEVQPAAAVAVWAALAAALWRISLVHEGDERPIPFAAGGILLAGSAWTITAIATPSRLVVDAASTIDHPLFWSNASLALLALGVALVVGFLTHRDSRAGHVMAAASAGIGVYLLSVGIVDEFQSRVGDGAALESLQKQSQVALSILWASLGILAFVIGLVRWGVMVRSFGLALLALATAKVFIYDLASLDTSYRVLSFIGLGVILLASSYAYQHFMPMFERQSSSEPPLEGGTA